MRILILTTIIFFSANAFLAQKNKKNKSELTNEIDSVSYSLGMNMAISFAKEFPEINYEQMIIQNYFMKKQQIKQAAEKEKMAPKIKEGQDFLAENGKRKNVVTTESGLQYEVIVQGDGPKPTLTDKVETHYHGTLIDGTVFDSSVERGESISFPVFESISYSKIPRPFVE